APGYAGTPEVEIDFNNFAGLNYTAGAAGSDLESLSLVRAKGNAVSVTGGGQMTITGNFIGLDLSGSTIVANTGNGIDLSASQDNVIGGDDASERNVISGNKGIGIRISAGSGNQVLGNYIGTDEAGTLDRGNFGSGVQITNASSNNTIGPDNLISGNNAYGVQISAGARLNNVDGNIIGLNVSQTAALGNTLDGVKV